MQVSDDLKKRAEEALSKESEYGENIDTGDYRNAPKDLETKGTLDELDSSTQEALVDVGVIPSGEGRSGSFLMQDNVPTHQSLMDRGVELMSVSQAMEKYDWVQDYSWNLVPVDSDKYTAKTYLEEADGYFIRALPGQQVKLPVQTCLLLGSRDATQYVHNIVIVEEGASLEVVTGCTTGRDVERALHLGISEMYVKEGGSLTFSMIHNWGEQIGVRPRTKVQVGREASFINNYVVLKPVKSVQSYPSAYLTEEGATAKFNTIAIAHPGSELDLGSRVVLSAPNTGAEIISRTITTGGTVYARGHMVGEAPRIKAHLECKGLIMKEPGVTAAIPQLDAKVPDVEMTHEASVGKIAQDQIEYLMARGLSEEQAVGMIVRGFLEGGIKGLPENLKQEIDRTISKADLSSM